MRSPDAGVLSGSTANTPSPTTRVMVIDRSIVVTGSFNFTPAAEENNAENVLVLSLTARALYRQNWQVHQQHSEPHPVGQ
jgi:phosphatidylserine/phosphatidylglycerophosphate/cardiolipin synthase-like enzyme